ncbi:MAG TPA: serine/threonine-protein kinase, partial [Gammaproteobacteria bacterium]
MTNGRQHRFALPAGYMLHWYEIDSVLGQGGFGITYLARDTNLNHWVAIKEFLPSDLASRTHDSSVEPISDGHSDTFGWGLQRFITEAQTLAKFRHPNIVLVYSVFEANNTAYMVMEYVEGRTLEDALKFKKIKGEAEFKRAVLALIDGLELVHDAGFIHRDIKPEN